MHLALNVVQLSLIKTTYMSNCLFCHVTAQKLWHFGNVIDQLSAVASLKPWGGTCWEQWGTRTVYPRSHTCSQQWALGRYILSHTCSQQWGTRTVYPHSHTCAQQWSTRTVYPRSHTCSQQWGTRMVYPHSHTCSQQWALGRCILTVTQAHSGEH